jgi:NADH-quinone oxidoreductase subunit C
MNAASLIESVTYRYPDAVSGSYTYRGDATVVLRGRFLLDVARFLREDPALDMNFLIDLTAVDYSTFGKRPAPAFFSSSGVAVRPSPQIPDWESWPGPPDQFRFGRVSLLLHVARHRLRLVVPVEEAAAEGLLTSVARANWLERGCGTCSGSVSRPSGPETHPDV